MKLPSPWGDADYWLFAVVLLAVVIVVVEVTR
jgi:hypothetical protein